METGTGFRIFRGDGFGKAKPSGFHPCCHLDSSLRTHTCTPYPYEHLRETEPAYYLEIYEVTVGASSSTGTSPLIESASPGIMRTSGLEP